MSGPARIWRQAERQSAQEDGHELQGAVRSCHLWLIMSNERPVFGGRQSAREYGELVSYTATGGGVQLPSQETRPPRIVHVCVRVCVCVT